MATHHWFCAWCGRGTGCGADEHILGSGQICCCETNKCGEVSFTDDFTPVFTIKAGQPQPLEFCTVECFNNLYRQMTERIKIAQRDYPEWFKDGR